MDDLIHVAVQDIDHLHAFLMDRFTKRKEIVNFRSSVIFQHTRNQVLVRSRRHTELCSAQSR